MTKTIPFAGFKIKVITCSLIPENKIYSFASHAHAKTFIEILKTFDTLIKLNKIYLVKKKPEKRIIRL